ncbi:MAG: 23S rRNA (pseudouridine(1915)-N(3))-methyltransferase RlmH, partial [Muribaculaceae bacterium]|nr:23S rRNA (pseudouridine(1915)-N(3))-methyltransferase RlmH [Muribaculaceae bacterium]
MKITLLVVGKTTSGYLGQGIDEYVRRLSHYVNFEMVCVSDARNTRNLSQSQQKQAEGRA